MLTVESLRLERTPRNRQKLAHPARDRQLERAFNMQAHQWALREQGRARQAAWRARISAEVAYLHVIRGRARLRGVPCTLSLVDVADLLAGTTICPVLKTPLRVGGIRGHRVTDDLATIDAFEPRKGYVPGNVFVLSHRANRLKSDATLAEIAALHRWMKRPH